MPSPKQLPRVPFLQSCWISLNTNLYSLLSLWVLVFCCFRCWRWLLGANLVFQCFSVRPELGFCLLCSPFLKFVLWVPSYSNYFLRQTCGYVGILSQEEAASHLAFILGILWWEQWHLGLYPARLQEAPLNRPQESKALNMMKYIFLDLLWHKPIRNVNT